MTEAVYLVYKHTSPSGKSYIGMTKNLKQRNAAHKIPSSKCAAFSNAIKKYGWDNFTHEILLQGLTLEEANQMEEQLICEHDTMVPNGYNLRTGGETQRISEHVKKQWSRVRKGKPRSPEHQAKLNEAARNRKRSPEHQAKLNEAAKRPRTEQTKQKISESKRGRIVSEATKAKLSAAGTGRVASEASREKMRARREGRRMYRNIITGERKYFYPEQFTTIPLDTWTPVV